MANRKDNEEEAPKEVAPSQPPKTWLDYSPEKWVGFIKTIGDEVIKPLKELYIEHETTKVKERRNLAYPVYLVIALIFVGVVFLAYQGMIDGQSVTFFAGTLVGYLLSYLGGYIGTTAQG